MAQNDSCCRSAVDNYHREIAKPDLVYISEIVSPFAVLFGRVCSKLVEVPDKREDRWNSKARNVLLIAENLVQQHIDQEE